MNEAEFIKKITACLVKGNKAAEKDAGILLQKLWANYAGRANRAHFWDNWEALLKKRAEELVGSRSEARFRAKPTSTAGPMNTIAVRTSVRRKKYLSARERRAADAPDTSSLSNPRAASVASDWVSEMAGRRFSLIAVDAYEDVSAPREISNRAADEFQELRDEIVEKRAARFLPHPDRGGHDGS